MPRFLALEKTTQKIQWIFLWFIRQFASSNPLYSYIQFDPIIPIIFHQQKIINNRFNFVWGNLWLPIPLWALLLTEWMKKEKTGKGKWRHWLGYSAVLWVEFSSSFPYSARLVSHNKSNMCWYMLHILPMERIIALFYGKEVKMKVGKSRSLNKSSPMAKFPQMSRIVIVKPLLICLHPFGSPFPFFLIQIIIQEKEWMTGNFAVGEMHIWIWPQILSIQANLLLTNHMQSPNLTLLQQLPQYFG
jgi:hypothetical protein